MAPEDVHNLVGSAVNYRNTLATEAHSLAQMKAAQAQHNWEQGVKAIELSREAAKDKKANDTVSYSEKYKKDGMNVRDIRNSLGQIIGTENLGDAKDDYAPHIVESPTGDLQFVKAGDQIPKGYSLPTTKTMAMNDEQKKNLDAQLAMIEGMIISGKDSKKKDVEPEVLKSYVDFYNKHSPDSQLIEGKSPPMKVPFTGNEIPYTGGKPIYTKAPKVQSTPSSVTPDNASASTPKIPMLGQFTAKSYPGRTVTNPTNGEKYKSDGTNWTRVQ